MQKAYLALKAETMALKPAGLATAKRPLVFYG